MFSFRALVLAFTLQTVFCPNTFSETSLGNHTRKVQETSNPDGRPTTAENQVSRNVSGRLEIKDRNGNLIGILVGDEIKNADGKILGTVVRDAAGNITSTAWDINQLGTLPEGSPLRKQYDELKQDIFRLQREAKEQINQLDTKINAADSDARRVSEEMNKLLSSWTGAIGLVLTNTVQGLQSTYEAHEREGNALKKQRADAIETQAKVEKLIKEGNLSEAYAVLNGKGDEFKRAMGNITAQTMRDLQGANQQLSQSIESANRWESGLRTARNIAVVGGAVIATGGLASAGFVATAVGGSATGTAVAAAVGGTVTGTAIGAASNFTEAHEQVNFGNMTSQEAYQRAWQQTGQDLLTSAQIGISGGTAGLAGRGVQGALGTVRAATTSGRLITGASAGAVSGFTGSALNTGTNMALGRETRSGGQIAVDTVTQTFVGGLSGGMGAGTQLRLDRLAAQQGGAVTATQQVTNRLVGDVVAPTALSAAGTYAANVATGRQGPTAEEFITNAAVAGLGAYTAGRASTPPRQSGSARPSLSRQQLIDAEIELRNSTSGGRQNNPGHTTEAEHVAAMLDYHKSDGPKTYEVNSVNEPKRVFRNGAEGQTDAQLTIFPDRAHPQQGVAVNVESKGRGVTIDQVAKYKSEGKKTIYVLRDEGNINQGNLFKIDQGFDSNINNARGEVFFMTRQEYNNFLRTGQIGEAFASFLSSRPGDKNARLTSLSPQGESKLLTQLERAKQSKK